MEFIWMMAGSNDVNWIEKFNSRYRQFADGDRVHGAYGHRWVQHFGGINQITSVIDILKRDRNSRRAVLGMWDPQNDLSHHNDLPCNTHIYFRVDREDGLNMTVCNRSNDVVWGMMGANVVHMTYLQELVAHGTGIDVGHYHVFSNNAHIYKSLPKYEEIINTRVPYDEYTDVGLRPMRLLQKNETVGMFLEDCHRFVQGDGAFQTQWMYKVAVPMYNAYMERKDKVGDGREYVKLIEAEDWRYACDLWINRR
jgi:thymidylate synthase